MLLHLEKVVAEVEDVESSVLPEEGDDHAAGPVEAVSEALPGKQERRHVSKHDRVFSEDVAELLHSLHCELVGSHRYTVHKLHGAPEAVKLHALIHVHHAVAGQRSTPNGVVQEDSHPREDDLKH